MTKERGHGKTPDAEQPPGAGDAVQTIDKTYTIPRRVKGFGDVIADNGCLAAALAYARRGWAVLPLHTPTGDGGCSCGKPACRTPGKHPRTAHGVRDASTDVAKLRVWWRRWPTANVGIAGGNGRVIMDVDGAEGAASIKGRHLPPSPTVQTGRGQHRYFALPADAPEPRNDGAVLRGVHMRSAGGYVVAPPSLHESGAHYEWYPWLSPDDVGLAPAPAWLLHGAASGKRRSAAPVAGVIPDGERNVTLASLAGTMRRRGMTAEEIFAALLVVNRARCAPPLADSEVRAIAASIGRYAPALLRIDRRLLQAPRGAQVLGLLMAAGVADSEMPRVVGVGERTIRRWRQDLREAGLEDVAKVRPSRRYVEVPRTVAVDCEVSTFAKALALAIAGYMRKGVAEVSQAQLCRATGASRRTVGHHAGLLRNRGHINVSRGCYLSEAGRRARSNCYTWPCNGEAAMDTENQRQAPLQAGKCQAEDISCPVSTSGMDTENQRQAPLRAGKCQAADISCPVSTSSARTPVAHKDQMPYK